MNDTFIIIGVMIALAALVAVIYFFKKKRKDIVTDQLQKEIDKLKIETKTPLGVKVLSQTTRTNEFLQAIDAGFELYQKIAKQEGYTNRPEPSHFTVLVFPSVKDTDSNGNYAPSFKVFLSKKSSYNGSVYDKGGYILAAEQVIGLENGIFAVADNNQFEYCKTAVYNGLEHLLLYYCDRERFHQTADHSQTGGHPIIELKENFLGLFSTPKILPSCGLIGESQAEIVDGKIKVI